MRGLAGRMLERWSWIKLLCFFSIEFWIWSLWELHLLVRRWWRGWCSSKREAIRFTAIDFIELESSVAEMVVDRFRAIGERWLKFNRATAGLHRVEPSRMEFIVIDPQAPGCTVRALRHSQRHRDPCQTLKRINFVKRNWQFATVVRSAMCLISGKLLTIAFKKGLDDCPKWLLFRGSTLLWLLIYWIRNGSMSSFGLLSRTGRDNDILIGPIIHRP